MKKIDLKKLALIGVTGAMAITAQGTFADTAVQSSEGILLAGGCASCGGSGPKSNATDDSKMSPATPAPTSPTTPPNVPSSLPNNKLADNFQTDVKLKPEAIAPKPVQGSMNEADLLKSLSAEARDKYNSLSPEGKALALQLANQACKGQNSCKGMNSCKTENNSCAGQGGCKGQSNCAFKNKNDAVKVAAQKMATKRASLTK